MRCVTTVGGLSQTARVDLDLGAGLELHGSESRVAARADSRRLRVPLTGPTVPDRLRAVRAETELAGRPLSEAFEPAPHLVLEHDWDGLGPDGAADEGSLPVVVRVGWTLEGRFPRPTSTRWWERHAVLGSWDDRRAGLGGLTPTPYHRLEPAAGVLWRGDGSRVAAVEVVDGRHRSRCGLGHLAAEPAELLVIDDSRVHVFDTAGLHRRTVDVLKGQRRASFEHDESGRLTRWTGRDALADYRVERHDEERVVVGGPAGIWATLDLDEHGRLGEVVDWTGATTRLQHDESGLLLSTVDALGLVTELDHDDEGRVVSIQRSTGARTDYARVRLDNGGHRVTAVTVEGRETSQSDEPGPEGGRRRTRTCCGSGASRVDESSPRGETTRFPDGTEATRRSSRRDDGTITTTVEQTTIRTPAGLTLSTRREQRRQRSGAVVERLAVGDRRWTKTLDPSQGTLTETRPGGRSQVLTVDPGRRVQVQDAGRPLVSYDYDDAGRPVRLTVGSIATELGYDEQGRLAWIDQHAERRELRHDPAGRLVAQQLTGGWIQFTHDAAGHVVGVSPPGRPTTALMRAADGRLEEVRYPEVGGWADVERFEYDRDGLLTRRVVEDGPEVRFERDAAGRVTSAVGTRTTIRARFDESSGQVLALETSAGDRIHNYYDGALLVIQDAVGRAAGRVERRYGHDHRIAAYVVGGEQLPVVRDPDGLATSVGPLHIEREPATGFVSGLVLGSVRTTRTYNGDGLVVREETRHGERLLFAEDMQRDATGRLTSVRETSPAGQRELTYEYDGGGRLAQAGVDGQPVLTLSHDANGNVVRYDRAGQVDGAQYDEADRLLSLGGRRYGYDGAGQLVRIDGSGGTRQLQYDDFGQLVAVVEPDGVHIEHHHDGLGRRIETRVNGHVVERLLWDGTRPAATLASDGTVSARFVYAGTGTAPEALLSDGRGHRLVTDHRGSVRLVVDAETGEVVQRLDYGPLGRLHADSAPRFQPFGYAGGLHDPHSGLVRFGVRDYDPGTGRFTARDPLRFAGRQANLFVYADGDPVNRHDPRGTQSEAGGSVKVCTAPFIGERPASIDHTFVETSEGAYGMDVDPNGIVPYDVAWQPDDKANHPEKECREVENVDEECLNEIIKSGQNLGTYGLTMEGPLVRPNVCYDAVWDALDACAGPGGWEYADSDTGEGPGWIESVARTARNARKVGEGIIDSVVDAVSGWL